jgi:phage terminase small subunit
MRPPRPHDSAGRAASREAVATLTEIGEDPALSRGALHRYASAVQLARELDRQWKAEGSPGIIVGPRGGVAAHPLPGLIEKAERAAADLGAALGLDPQARRRMGRRVGRPAGAASARDRKADVVPIPRRTERPDAG